MPDSPILITYAEIAEVLGYSKDFVLGALRRELAAYISGMANLFQGGDK